MNNAAAIVILVRLRARIAAFVVAINEILLPLIMGKRLCYLRSVNPFPLLFITMKSWEIEGDMTAMGDGAIGHDR
jgi:hypothetical protein